MMETGEAHGSVTGYFREREEVSALYTCLTCSLARRRTELAVLLRDAGLTKEEMETLRFLFWAPCKEVGIHRTRSCYRRR